MKKFFLFFVAALFCTYGYADKAVTVNFNGSATQGHFPVYGDNADSEGHKVQAIYLANQLKGIAEGSEIKALTFYSSQQTQSWGKAEFKVSLAKTDYTYFPNSAGVYATASEGSSLTTVYDDKLSVADGELTVNFTKPYTYEGGNLLIQVEVSRGGSFTSSSFYSASNTDYLIKYAYSGSSRETKQPKITFVIAESGSDPVSAACKAPTDVTIDAITDVTATISWQGEASQYQYCLEFEGDMPNWSAAQLTDQKSVSLSGLYDEQKYYLYVRSYCSESEVSEYVKVTFKTACARMNLPWIETFTRDDASSEWNPVQPDCWFIASEKPDVFVTRDKTYDEEGSSQVVYTQAHLAARGNASYPQVFAMPAVNGRLDTLEVAFDYSTTLVGADYNTLEVGYMTNPSNADSFVNIKTLPQTLTSTHAVVTLENAPADAFIAFRFAGGSSTYCVVSMDNFVVAGIGKSGDVDLSEEDLPDPSIWSLSYCDAGYTWYYYGQEQYFGMLLISDDLQDTIAAVFTSTGDCEQFAQWDGVEFPQDDPNAEYLYYFNTRYILNVDDAGLMKFGAFDACTVNIGGTGENAQLGLKAGSYHVEVFELIVEYDSETGEATKVSGLGDKIASIPFTLTSYQIYNLQAVVADDHKTATLTWEAPELGQGQRLYVRVWSGETVAYDNFETNLRPTSPLVVEVEEGKTYTVVVQVIDKKGNALGDEQTTSFTVGVNQYEPKNPNAEVKDGDNVIFSWEADATADRYVIALYLDGVFYSTLTVIGTSKMTTMPVDGTWSWTVQAFNEGTNGNYFEASSAVEGNSFVSKSADIPEDAIELEVTGLNAYYIEPNTEWYQEGKNGWILQFGLGTAGYNYAWFLVYTAKPMAISGIYNLTRGNLDSESDGIFLEGSNDPLEGTESEVRLQFDGYDEVEVTSTYSVTKAFYTGSFRLVGEDGKTYVGRFMELMCSSGDFANYYYGNPSNHITLSDEDPDYNPYEGIEEIIAGSKDGLKVLRNGQLLIIRDSKAYNVLGTLVK